MNKEKRKQFRVLLMEEAIGWSKESNLLNVRTCKVSNISKSGTFIECSEMPEVDEILEIYIQLPAELGMMTLKGKVAWRRWATTKKSKLSMGFGIEFIFDSPKYEKIMESYTIYLRNKQIIVVSKKIIEEFLGTRQPPTDKGPIA